MIIIDTVLIWILRVIAVAAFAGAASSALGYVGLICGAIFAGLVYVIIAVIVYRFYLTACEKPGEDEEDAE